MEATDVTGELGAPGGRLETQSGTEGCARFQGVTIWGPGGFSPAKRRSLQNLRRGRREQGVLALA